MITVLVGHGQNTPIGQPFSYNIKKYTSANSELIHDRINNLQFDKENTLYAITSHGYSKLINWDSPKPMVESVHNLSIGRYNALIHKDQFCSFDRENKFYYHSKDSTSLFFPSRTEKILNSKTTEQLGLILLDRSSKLIFVRRKNDYDSIQLPKKFIDPYSFLFAVDTVKNIYISSQHPDSLDANGEKSIYKFSLNGVLTDSVKATTKNKLLIRLKTESPHFLLDKPELTFHSNLEDFLFNNCSVENFGFYAKIYFDRSHQLFWMVQDKHLIGFHHKKGMLHQIPIADKMVNSSKILFCNSFIFIATVDGLIQVEIKKNKFSTIQDSTLYGLRRIKKKPNGSIQIASDKSLFQLDSNLNSIQTFKPIPILFPSSFIDSKENIWVNYRGTIYIFNNAGQLIDTLKYHERTSRDQPLVFNWGFLENNKKIIWTIVGEKLIGFQNRKKDYEINLKPFAPRDVFEIIENDSTHLWICSSKGLLKTNRFSGLTELFSNQRKGIHYLPCRDIHDLFIDKNGIFWIASGDNGLIRWSYGAPKNDLTGNKSSSYQVFNTHFGMPSNIITGIEADDFGFLWIGTEKGLVRFHKESHNFEVFTQDNGTTDNEFNRLSHYKDEDGIIYFGGLNGVTYFNPRDFLYEKRDKKLSIIKVFTNFQSEQEDKTEIFASKKVIQLTKEGSGLELVYGNQSPQSKVFYSLNDGVSWWETADNKIILNNLPVGSFRLHIKEEAINGSIINNLVIPVETPLPFYLKPWFYISVLMSILLLGIGLFKWRTILLRKRKEELESIIEERTRTIVEQGKKLQQQHDTQSRFFRNIAHELKTPLTLINGSTNLMEQTSSPPLKEHQKKLLFTIQQNSNTILNLSDEILLLSRLQSKQFNTLNFSPISALLLFQKLFDSFLAPATLEEKKYVFNHNLLPSTTILVDPGKIEKIVLNLISNAFKYTNMGDQIFLNVQQNHQENILQIEVKDTGKGIDASDLPYIFDPFFRSKADEDIYELQEIAGAGVGLAIVKELTDICRGKIHVKSKLYEGSTFRVSIPCEVSLQSPFLDAPSMVSHSSEEFTNKSFQFPQMTNHNHHVLIIEDSKELGIFLERFLEQHFHVSIANDTKKALDILSKSEKNQQKATISLIITDLLLPSQFGLDFIKQLKKNVKWRTIPIIITSSDYTNTNKRQAQTLGIKYFLPKPYSLNRLLTCIYKSLESNSINPKILLSKDVTQTDEMVLKINEAIYNNLHNGDLTIELLANQLSISKRHLTRIIKRNTGLSPMKYINELRLRKARELLKNQSYFTVSEVVYAVGFKSPNYFTKLFKSRFGRLPSSFFE